MSRDEILAFYRRVMDAIHAAGNIYYDAALGPAAKCQQEEGRKEGEKPIFYGRYEAYKSVALLASNLRRENF